MFALTRNWMDPNAWFDELEECILNLHIICSDSEYGLLLLIHILYSYTLYSQKMTSNPICSVGCDQMITYMQFDYSTSYWVSGNRNLFINDKKCRKSTKNIEKTYAGSENGFE